MMRFLSFLLVFFFCANVNSFSFHVLECLNYHVAKDRTSEFWCREGSRGWEKTNRQIMNWTRFADQPANLQFEETPLQWYFDQKTIDGRSYTHAWIATCLDFLVPSTENHTICAPDWYVEKKRIEREKQARNQYVGYADFDTRDAVRRLTEGHVQEAKWGVYDALLHVSLRDECSCRRNIDDSLSNYEKARDAFRWTGFPSLNELASDGVDYLMYAFQQIKANAAAMSVVDVLIECVPDLLNIVPVGRPVSAAISGSRWIAEKLTVTASRTFARRVSEKYGQNFYRKFDEFKGNDTPQVRQGTTGYKTGKKWESLEPVNTPKAERKIGHINKNAFGGGEMRTDGEFVYRFDPAHKSGKIHMEQYKKTSRGWQPCAECDPVTGNEIPGSSSEMLKRGVIKW